MATEAITLDEDAFARMVTEHGLKQTEVGGYVYAGKQGKHGWELYKSYGPKWAWLWQCRRVVTQDNAGGGALALRVSLATGQTARIVQLRTEGPVTNTANNLYVLDEDGSATTALGTVTGASAVLNFPSIGANANTSLNNAQSTGMLLGPGQYLRIQASASAQTETLTFALVLLLSSNTAPTWDTTGSAGTPNLAASTISTANTFQRVLLP